MKIIQNFLMFMVLILFPTFLSAHSGMCSTSYSGEFSQIPVYDSEARPTISDLHQYVLQISAQEGIVPFLRLNSLPNPSNLEIRNGQPNESDEVSLYYVAHDNSHHKLELEGRAYVLPDSHGSYNAKFYFQTKRPFIMYKNADVEVNVRIESVCEH